MCVPEALGNRLQSCAELVRGNKTAVDVGTDHAYLACQLVRAGISPNVIAADVREGPLKSAREHIRAQGLDGQITVVLSDGLEGISPDGVGDIIIAGMGGELIATILENCPWTRDSTLNFILQPMTRAAFLREWLAERGFKIQREIASREGKFLYTAMQVRYTGEIQKISKFAAHTGKLNPKNSTDKALLLRTAEKISAAAQGMMTGGKQAQGEQSMALAGEIRTWVERQEGTNHADHSGDL